MRDGSETNLGQAALASPSLSSSPGKALLDFCTACMNTLNLRVAGLLLFICTARCFCMLPRLGVPACGGQRVHTTIAWHT